MSTDVQNFLADLDGGVFSEKLSHAFSDVAAGVIQHGRVGKVTLTFDLDQIGNSSQVHIKHKLGYVKPTAKGKLSEENTTETPMYVGKKGALSLFPEDQTDMFGKDQRESKLS